MSTIKAELKVVIFKPIQQNRTTIFTFFYVPTQYFVNVPVRPWSTILINLHVTRGILSNSWSPILEDAVTNWIHSTLFFRWLKRVDVNSFMSTYFAGQNVNKITTQKTSAEFVKLYDLSLNLVNINKYLIQFTNKTRLICTQKSSQTHWFSHHDEYDVVSLEATFIKILIWERHKW